MIQINRATDSFQFRQISDLAAIIWAEHYTPIIGADQVIYMLDKFQSVDAIKKQILEGSEYYVLTHEGIHYLIQRDFNNSALCQLFDTISVHLRLPIYFKSYIFNRH